MKKLFLIITLISGILATGCKSEAPEKLPRAEATLQVKEAVAAFITHMEENDMDLHSLMVIKDGKVIAEHWESEGAPDKPHVMFSVSKTFTATAVHFAIEEGKLDLDDKVISFFTEKLPETVSENLENMTVWDLLTMTCGHHRDYTRTFMNPKNKVDGNEDWISSFLAIPVEHEPGTYFVYNTIGTFMLSAIVQKVTGEKIVDYLQPRLFDPLKIEKPHWDENPQGINVGGSGLFLKTEDMAKFGVMFLNKGKYYGKRILTEEWTEEASRKQVSNDYSKGQSGMEKISSEDTNWNQGYGYQMWRRMQNCYSASGLRGQNIWMIPEKNTVVITTAKINATGEVFNAILDYIYPAV